MPDNFPEILRQGQPQALNQAIGGVASLTYPQNLDNFLGQPNQATSAVDHKSVKRKGLQYLKSILTKWQYFRFRVQGKLIVRGHQSGLLYSLNQNNMSVRIPVPGGTLKVSLCVQVQAASSDRISVLYDYARFNEAEIWKVGNITETKLERSKSQ